MNLELDHKVALVTGASAGIGAATAVLLAEEGADVVVCFRRGRERAQRTAGDIERLGRRAWLCSFDATDPASVQRAITSLPAPAQKLDIVVLCAGENQVTPLADVTPAEWARVIDSNLNGTFHVLQAVQSMLNDQASIVIVASVAAHSGAPHHPHYAAAKAGLVNLTKSAARALAPRVRVNCVAPGITRTEMGQQTVASLPPDYAQRKLLTGRYAEPREIANCIVFVASPAASFMTGATLDVNGGRDLR